MENKNHWGKSLIILPLLNFKIGEVLIFICFSRLRVLDRILAEKNLFNIYYINSAICTSIPSRESDPEMNNLVQKLQTHSHTAYCCKGYKSSCRFGFPKKGSLCDIIKVFGNVDFSHRNKGKFYETKKNSNECMINSYNSIILRHWRANMDIQVICNAEGAAYYVCSYICKSEPDELKSALGNLIHQVFKENPNIPRYQRLLKIGLCVYVIGG